MGIYVSFTYHRTVNAGKSVKNEDQSCVHVGHITRTLNRSKELIEKYCAMADQLDLETDGDAEETDGSKVPIEEKEMDSRRVSTTGKERLSSSEGKETDDSKFSPESKDTDDGKFCPEESATHPDGSRFSPVPAERHFTCLGNYSLCNVEIIFLPTYFVIFK